MIICKKNSKMLLVRYLKRLVIFLINVYQKIPGPFHSYCRHNPSCSNYTKEAVEKYGFAKGLGLGIKRIIRCNPFGSSGYDPVPDLRRKK